MICGFVLAKKGEKISKSKNNAGSSPKELIKMHSADALRYWAAGAKLGTDTMFSEEDLKISRRLVTKLWNAAKFTLMHLDDFDFAESVDLMTVDRWIIEKQEKTTAIAQKYLNEYEVGLARKEIDDFFWNDYCDNYLEIVKDRLYKPEVHGKENRRSAQRALYKSFLGILKLYSIFIPHVTEEIYQDYYRNFEGTQSIHTTLWDKCTDFDEALLEYGNFIESILLGVRKFKSERNLSMKDSIDKLIISMPSAFYEPVEASLKDLYACTSALEIEISECDSFSIEVANKQS
jgi:valyl-tRNA synthetase